MVVGSDFEAAALTSVNGPENGSAQWWKLDEESVSNSGVGAGGAAGASPWESSLKSDLIDFKSLFRVKRQFN